MTEILGIKPAFVDRYGPAYAAEDVDNALIKAIEEGSNLLVKRGKTMTAPVTEAGEVIDRAISAYSDALRRLEKLEAELHSTAKKAASDTKDASEKIAQGIARVEKAADFSRLERYVTLLERAASAMNALGEIEKSGKLEKIASAIR